MNSKERVNLILNHKEADMVPIQSHFTPEFQKKLINKYNMDNYELEVFLGNDILCSSFGMVTGYYHEENVYTTEWGITWKKYPYNTKYGVGYYTEIVEFPLANDKNLNWFL